MLSRSEEDHIKAVHRLQDEGAPAGTKDVADRLGIRPSSVTVMLKKLAEKGLLKHEPYYGVKLTPKGRAEALKLVRKHRLWETFLVQHLQFGWDEVHELAEQLEHVQSAVLTDRLAHFLGDPLFDPHGDPIPDRRGRLPERAAGPLGEVATGKTVRLVAVHQGNDQLLQLLDRKGMRIGDVYTVEAVHAFDGSMELRGAGHALVLLSAQVAGHLLVEPAKKPTPHAG